jgi:hypothetical protein
MSNLFLQILVGLESTAPNDTQRKYFKQFGLDSTKWWKH